MPKHMSVPFEIKEFEQNGDFFEFSGYASTFGNVDRGNDVVIKGAFKKSISELTEKASESGSSAVLPVLWQHDAHEPIGSFIELREDDYGLFVKARLPIEDTLVSGRVIPQIRAESVKSMSIGYLTKDSEYKNGSRHLKEIALLETSLVTIPMNELATLSTGLKAATDFSDLPIAPRSAKWDKAGAESRVKKFTNSGETPGPEYKNAFIWSSSNNQDSFDSYKIQCADVVDGKLTVVPHAIFSAAASIRAKGLSAIPDEDRAAVVRHIEGYYSKMDLESPFQNKNSFRIDDIKSITERELESVLQSGVHCTRKSSKFIASLIKSGLKREAEAGEAKRDALADEISEKDYDDVLKLFSKEKN